MIGINKVTLVGHLGSDPETKKISSQQTVTNFSIATSDSWLNKEGERQEKTEWHRIVVWGKLAETCGKYLSKGRQVYLEGRLQTRSWETEQGQKKYTTEIVAAQILFLGKSSASGGGDNKTTNSTSSSSASAKPEPEFNDNAEDLPF